MLCRCLFGFYVLCRCRCRCLFGFDAHCLKLGFFGFDALCFDALCLKLVFFGFDSPVLVSQTHRLNTDRFFSLYAPDFDVRCFVLVVLVVLVGLVGLVVLVVLVGLCSPRVLVLVFVLVVLPFVQGQRRTILIVCAGLIQLQNEHIFGRRACPNEHPCWLIVGQDHRDLFFVQVDEVLLGLLVVFGGRQLGGGGGGEVGSFGFGQVPGVWLGGGLGPESTFFRVRGHLGHLSLGPDPVYHCQGQHHLTGAVQLGLRETLLAQPCTQGGVGIRYLRAYEETGQGLAQRTSRRQAQANTLSKQTAQDGAGAFGVHAL